MTEKRDWKLMTVLLAMAFAGYGIFMKIHYSVDSYASYFAENSQIQMQSSRYLNYILDTCVRKLGLSPVANQQIFTVILICAIAYTAYYLTELFNRELFRVSGYKKYGLGAVILLSFLNVCVVEWFIYAETTLYYGVSLLTMAWGVSAAMRGKRLINFIMAYIFIQLSLFSYQASMPYFVAFGLCYATLEYFSGKSIGIYIKKAVYIILSAGMASLISMLLNRVTSGAAVDRTVKLTFGLLMNNIRELLDVQRKLWINNFGFLPKYFMLGLVLLLLAGIFLEILQKRQRKYLLVLLALAGGYLIIWAPHMVVTSLWVMPRTIVGIWGWISCCGIFLLYLGRDQRIYEAVTILFFAFLLGNARQIIMTAQNNFRVEECVRQEAESVGKYIRDYEEKNSVKITKIATILDKEPTYYYPNILYTYGDINARCFTVDWGDVFTLNYYNDTKYEKIEMDPQIEEQYFAGKNWDSLQLEEQCIFFGDTVYWCIY